MGVGSSHWHGHPPCGHPLKKSDSASISSCPLSIAPQLGVEPQEPLPLHAVFLTGLLLRRPCAGNHSCWVHVGRLAFPTTPHYLQLLHSLCPCFYDVLWDPYYKLREKTHISSPKTWGYQDMDLSSLQKQKVLLTSLSSPTKVVFVGRGEWASFVCCREHRVTTDIFG